MSKNTYEYAIENEEERYEFKTVFVSDSETGRNWIAQDAAEDFYNNHDGWEASWPIDFSIFSGEKFVGSFSVHCEAVPQFSAYRVTQEAA